MPVLLFPPLNIAEYSFFGKAPIPLRKPGEGLDGDDDHGTPLEK
jgi:hypothetical protein